MRLFTRDTMTMEGGTDLDRLHHVVSMENPGRGAGRTFSDCHTVAGAMETSRWPGVVCIVPKYDRVNHIMRTMVFKVFMDHGIGFYKALSNYRFIFSMQNKQPKELIFIVSEDVEHATRGRLWPVVEFTEYTLREKGADNWIKRPPLM